MIIESLQILAVPIASLREDPKNARIHPERNLGAIKASLAKFGQRKPVVALKDGTVIAGNGTLRSALALGWDKIAVVRVDDDRATAAAYALADNRTAELAIWDEETLAATLKEIKELGTVEIDVTGFSLSDVDAFLRLGAGGTTEDLYSKKIKIPIYEPTGEKPDVAELVDSSKAEDLRRKIASHNIPQEVSDFLVLAAARHAVFNYEKIAEYYAHASKEIQELMEDSALVIIDFKKAIEQGFVRMSDALAEGYIDVEAQER
jgi:hypothetical protein